MTIFYQKCTSAQQKLPNICVTYHTTMAQYALQMYLFVGYKIYIAVRNAPLHEPA